MERELNGDAGAVYIDPDARNTPFKTVAESWWAARDVKRSSHDRYRTALDTHILPRWGPVPIGAISARDLAGWMTRLKRGGGVTDIDKGKLGASQRRTVFTVANSIFDWAVPDLIASNPMQDKKKIKRPKPNHVHHHAYLDYPEIEALADLCDGLLTKRARPAVGVVEGVHGMLIRTLAYTGLRAGEALALRVQHVKHALARPVLQVRATLVEDDRTGEIYFQDPKSNESRDVPIAASLVPGFAALCEGKSEDDLVFSIGGLPIRLRNWRNRIFNIARGLLGLPAALTPHKLRHTAASLAIRAGATVLGVQKLLGHASPTETLKTYMHLWDDEIWKVADVLDRGRIDSLAVAAELDGVTALVAEIADRLDEVQALLELIGIYDGSDSLHRELERVERRSREVGEFLHEVAAGVDAGWNAAMAQGG
ncbi:tyrosine-type recombinase/integrase [Glycomyces terrestris]|uniref:Site-specific integrase n=1 Tax=Glycomyces terrestris TaxID=2493553 RepID=A0A426URP8_9ACTN|nr:tyrosine-type recombinase/integrase [Glycomyces terrestris]RRR95842.1 site-specific integrase [Glycomyces terrestris]